MGGSLLRNHVKTWDPNPCLRRNCNGAGSSNQNLADRTDSSSLLFDQSTDCSLPGIPLTIVIPGIPLTIVIQHWLLLTCQTLSSYQRVFLMVITLSWQPTSSTRRAPGSWSTLGLVQPQIVQQDGLAQHTVHPIYGRFQLGGASTDWCPLMMRHQSQVTTERSSMSTIFIYIRYDRSRRLISNNTLGMGGFL